MAIVVSIYLVVHANRYAKVQDIVKQLSVGSMQRIYVEKQAEVEQQSSRDRERYIELQRELVLCYPENRVPAKVEVEVILHAAPGYDKDKELDKDAAPDLIVESDFLLDDFKTWVDLYAVVNPD